MKMSSEIAWSGLSPRNSFVSVRIGPTRVKDLLKEKAAHDATHLQHRNFDNELRMLKRIFPFEFQTRPLYKGRTDFAPSAG